MQLEREYDTITSICSMFGLAFSYSLLFGMIKRSGSMLFLVLDLELFLSGIKSNLNHFTYNG